LGRITIVDILDLTSCNFIAEYVILAGNTTAITKGSNQVEVERQIKVIKTKLESTSDLHWSWVVILGYPCYLACV